MEIKIQNHLPPQRENDPQFRILIEAVKDYAIFMLDPAGNVMTWNAGAERIQGYKAEEIIGKHFSCFYTDEDVEQEKPLRGLELAKANERYEAEGWRVRKDGSKFWTNVVITAMRDRSGQFIGFAKVTRDLTEQKHAEDQARTSHLLIGAVKDYAVFMLDAAGKVVTWNSGAERIKGYKAEEIIGKHFSSFYPAEDHPMDKLLKGLDLVKAAGRCEAEGWRVRKDGSKFWANLIITAMRDRSGQLIGFAKITRDLTERKQVEEKLPRAWRP